MKWLTKGENRLVAARAKLALHEYNSLKTSHKAVKNILKLTALGTASAVGVAGAEGGYVGLHCTRTVFSPSNRSSQRGGPEVTETTERWWDRRYSCLFEDQTQ